MATTSLVVLATACALIVLGCAGALAALMLPHRWLPRRTHRGS